MYAVDPERVFALSGDDFTGSPTRWRFPSPSLDPVTLSTPGTA
jgi:hypothetical protein